MEDLQKVLDELIKGGKITKKGSWYCDVATGNKFHGDAEIFEHIRGDQKTPSATADNIPNLPDPDVVVQKDDPSAKVEPEVTPDPVVKPKPKPKPKLKISEDYVLMVAIDKRSFGRCQIKHGMIVDFGKHGEKIALVPADNAKRLAYLHKTQFRILDPECAKSLVAAPTPKRPSEYTDAELMRALVERYKNPGLFMHDLRKLMIEVKGDVFPITGCLSDEEMIADLRTTCQYAVMSRDNFNQANAEKTQVHAENADLRSQLNMKPRPEPIN